MVAFELQAQELPIVPSFIFTHFKNILKFLLYLYECFPECVYVHRVSPWCPRRPD